MSLRNALLAPALLFLLAPLAGAHGPYSATLGQGQVHTYLVDHPGPLCHDAWTRWYVTLTYEPPTDTLTLASTSGGASVGKDGRAQVTFTTSTSCAVFEVAVHGTLVRDEASYTLTVTTGAGQPVTQDLRELLRETP